MEEGIRCFLDGPQDGGDVDDGCLAATQALFFAVLGSLLQQRQEGLGRNNLVRHLSLKTVSLIATATQGGGGRTAGCQESPGVAAVALPAPS